jgi:hypothetical protein
LFRSEFFFQKTQELEYFFLSRKAQFFSPHFNIRLYDKNSESDFFFPPPKSEYFFSNIGNQNIFLEKNHNPPLQVKWSFPNITREGVQKQKFAKMQTNQLIILCVKGFHF